MAIYGGVGYVAVPTAVALETIGVPVPGETTLVAAAVLAGQGRLDLTLVIALAAAGAIVGDNVGYLLGRRFGRRLLLAPGPFARRRRHLVEAGDRFFAAHGAAAVFLGRWVAVGRMAAAWLAGADRMRWRRFAVWNAAGGIAWATSVGLVAYALGAAGARWLAIAGTVAAGVTVAKLTGLTRRLPRPRRFAMRRRAYRIRPYRPQDQDLMTTLHKTLIAFVATAVLAVCAVAVAAEVTHRDDSPSPAHTVRDFLLAAVVRHDGLHACRYVTRQALVDIHGIEPRGMSCEAAVSSYAHLDLGGDRVDTQASVKALDYRTESEADGRERVTVSANGDSRSFALRRATQRELVEYSAPPTPWRIDAGLDALVTR